MWCRVRGCDGDIRLHGDSQPQTRLVGRVVSLTRPFAVVSPAMTLSVWRAALAVSYPWYSCDVLNIVPSGSAACSCQVSTPPGWDFR